MTWPVDVSSESESSPSGSLPGVTTDWRGSCSHCPRLVESLTRQSEAMERLTDLLPQLIAQNQMLIEAVTDQDDEDEPETYLDGSPRR